MIDQDAAVPSLGAHHKLFCFGHGYCARALAAKLSPAGVQIAGTRTRVDSSAVDKTMLAAFDGSTSSAEVSQLLAATTHLLVSIPPGGDGDPALRVFAAELARLPTLTWIGYLSTIGVYGDTGGAWVDETTPVRPASPRAVNRVVAEDQWRAFGAQTGKIVNIFRLPGIYGPSRGPLEAVRAGTARRVVKPGQVFNRVHVADIAAVLARAMALAATGHPPLVDTFNVVDDEPAPPQDVVAYAARLLGVSPPPEVAFDAADLTPMARSFYGENKRVANSRIKTVLSAALIYPTYRDGLRADVGIVAGA